jgi:hypothetical protein
VRVDLSRPNSSSRLQVGQVAWSHHWMEVRARLIRHSAPYRFVWSSELDLMAQLAGLSRQARWAGWQQQPFDSDSTSQVMVYRKLPVESTDISGPFR